MDLCTGLAGQPVPVHVVHRAAFAAIRAPPSAAESAVSAHLLVVFGSKDSEAAAQESLSLNAPVIGQRKFTLRWKLRLGFPKPTQLGRRYLEISIVTPISNKCSIPQQGLIATIQFS